MAGYRRFVAYVYEYRKEKKDVNCGFVRVEVRGGICAVELHLKCPGLAAGEVCSVYGFIRREEELEGVFLGNCMTGEGQISCRLETEAENMGQSDASLEQMGGMVFCTEQGAFFGTEWDDRPIVPERFRKERKPEEAPEKTPEEGQREEPEEGNLPEAEHPEGTGEMRAEEVFSPGKAPCCAAFPGARRETDEPGERFFPFSDGEYEYCRKIQPRDLMRLSRRECALRNNRFLSHGYYNFGHLLLGRRRDGQYILGVPGGYDQQEHFMAGMFGFPYFKESAYIELDGGNGGYWYRLIDAPDLCGGDPFPDNEEKM